MLLSHTFRRRVTAQGSAGLAIAALALGAATADASLLPLPATTPPATTPATTPAPTTPAVPATTPADQPGPPDVVHASDAPLGTLTPNPAPGTNLIAIGERVMLPKATPAQAPTPAPAAALGPSLTFRSASRDLEVARERGLRLKVAVAGANRLKVYALISRAAAERTTDGTGLEDESGATVTLARTSVSRPASGTIVATLRFGPSAQETLMQFARVRITVRLVATDARGHRTVVDRPLDLR